MTGLIKSNAQRRAIDVRPFPLTIAADHPDLERHGKSDEMILLANELDRLTAELAARDFEIAGHGSAVAAARAEGESVGREAAERAFEDDRRAALDQLKMSVEEALAGLAVTLSQLEPLSLLVAREAIDKLVGDPDYRQELLVALISRQFEQLERSSIVHVTVSAADFPEAAELAVLEAALGEGTRITRDHSALPGSCTIGLKVGTLEVGLDPQWTHIRALLSEMGNLGDAL